MHNDAIVITGRGLVTASGSTVAAFESNLAAGRGGIMRHTHLFPDAIYAGLALPFGDAPGLDVAAPHGCDRTAKMAVAAAVQALNEAGLWDEQQLTVDGERVALLLGSSHGGRAQLDRFIESGMDVNDLDMATGVLERGAHYHQTAVLAVYLGVHGPVATMSTACSSSGVAIAYGVELLRSGGVEVVIVGGADAFSKLTYAGFTALGATAETPCGPFGATIGLTLGEGAAFLVLEREKNAKKRGAIIHGEIYACGTTWDAHHLTAPEPGGDGMRRAIQNAIESSGIAAGEVNYINAHATGTRANDISETLAIKRAFETFTVPPISATKSFTGHTLGASSAIGLIASLTAMDSGVLPPTLNFGGPRAGCDLDYVSEAPRAAEVHRFLSLSAAFGGANCAIFGGLAGLSHAPVIRHEDAVVITGMGVISPLGCDPKSFGSALFAGRIAGKKPEQPELASVAPLIARVADFDPRKQLPGGSGTRMNRISQYATAAIGQALVDAGMPAHKRRPIRLGLMVGLCRGAAVSFETYLESVRGERWDHASPTAFPNLVMSSVGGQAAIALGLKGVASTIVGSADTGLTLLAQAAECLRAREDIDGIVVVTSDELSSLYLRLEHTRRGGPAALPPAEGACALVLERREHALQRGARVRAVVAGWGQTFDAAGGPSLAPDGAWLEKAIRTALRRAECSSDTVDLMITLARGECANDEREAAVLGRLFAHHRPVVTALGGQVGMAEATCGLYAVACALLALETGRVPAPAGALAGLPAPWLREAVEGGYDNALVAGSGEMGNNAAILLRRDAEN